MPQRLRHPGKKRGFATKTAISSENQNPNPKTTMSVPQKWNMIGARWNSSPILKWNGLQPTTKTMNTKAIIDFSSYTAAEFAFPAQTIHDKMTANAATFTAPPVSMAALQAIITTYEQKLVARASRDSDAVIAFGLARHNLEAALHDLGLYVNIIAKGDATIVGLSGFPSYTVGPGANPAPSAIPAGPQNLRLGHGGLGSSITGRFKPDRVNSYNVAQLCTGDPNVEANWKTVLQFSGGKFTLTGLTVGSTVWVRVATVGAGGALGPWSDPAKIVVT